MKLRKRKTIWAYLDGKKLIDVVQAALDNNMTVNAMKALLIKENQGNEVTFKCEWEKDEVTMKNFIMKQVKNFNEYSKLVALNYTHMKESKNLWSFGIANRIF